MNDKLVAASTAYLGSRKAAESLARDPYWPKWDSPWWHMLLLWELGRADAIPQEAAEAMFAAIERQHLRFFPTKTEPLPPGKDAARDALCHCALGTMAQVLRAKGLDLDARAPWIRAWFLRYQLPDGGLNCDERAYDERRGSSALSTVAALEAVLDGRDRFTPAEEEFADRAAGWLLERRLAFRLRDGRPMSEDFLKIGFPRFYDYDVLRGLSAVARWSRARRKDVPRAAVREHLDALAARFPDGRPKVERRAPLDRTTLAPGADGAWKRGPATRFTLLDAASREGSAPEALARAYDEARKALR